MLTMYKIVSFGIFKNYSPRLQDKDVNVGQGRQIDSQKDAMYFKCPSDHNSQHHCRDSHRNVHIL